MKKEWDIAWSELERCMQSKEKKWQEIDRLYVKCGGAIVFAHRHAIHAMCGYGFPRLTEWTWSGYAIKEGVEEIEDDIKTGRLIKVDEKIISDLKVEYYTTPKPPSFLLRIKRAVLCHMKKLGREDIHKNH